MVDYDEKSGKIRPTWTVRFTPGMTLLGCAIAGAVTGALLTLPLLLAPGTIAVGDSTMSTGQLALMALGVTFGVFLILGPTLAWGLGFMLRHNTNQWVHVMAFGVLGLVVGFMLGNFIGIGANIAPAAGIGAAVGRWGIRNATRI